MNNSGQQTLESNSYWVLSTLSQIWAQISIQDARKPQVIPQQSDLCFGFYFFLSNFQHIFTFFDQSWAWSCSFHGTIITQDVAPDIISSVFIILDMKLRVFLTLCVTLHLNRSSSFILLLIFIMSFCRYSEPVLALVNLTNYYQQTSLTPFQAVHEYGDQRSPSRGSTPSPLRQPSISLKKGLVWWAAPSQPKDSA